MTTRKKCQYCSPDGPQCNEPDMGGGYCFWHDPQFDKSGMDLKDKLEHYAQNGGLLHGLQLKRTNLAGLSLINRSGGKGFDISYSDLYRANLKGAHLFNLQCRYGSLMKADLREANLHCAQLGGTNLLGVKLADAKLNHTHFGHILFQEEKGLEAEKQNDYQQAKDNFEQAEEIYRNIRNAAEKEGLFEMAGSLMHKELVMRRMQMPKPSFKRGFSKLLDLFCGYGERPANVVLFSLVLIFVCALGYYNFGVSIDGELARFDHTLGATENIKRFFSVLYFSVVTFTTLGYGDITPMGFSRVIAALEAFSGSFTIAMFVVVFVTRIRR